MLARPGQAACKLDHVIDLPVTMQGMQPLTDVSMNDHPVRLVVDSGGFFSLITPGTAAELSLPQQAAPPGFTMRGIGGEVQPSIGTVRNFTVGSVTLHNLEFLVGGSEVGAAGVLGQNVLHFRDIEYDLGAGMVRMMASRDCGRANLAYWARPDQPVATLHLLSEENGSAQTEHTIGTVIVNGVPLRAIFDTGAGSTSLTMAAAARAGVHVGDAGVDPAGFGSGIGRQLVRHWIAPFRTVDIGGEQIRNTRMRIADLKDVGWDMLVGADFFLSHHVYVANALHMMFLTYNGGQVFRLRDLSDQAGGAAADAPAPGTAAVEAPPTDAQGFARRGAARLARRDPAAALADLDEAVKRAPDQPRFLLERARIHLGLRQPLLAGNDLDAAVRLAPEDVEIRLVRAGLRLAAHDRDGAREDVEAAARLAPKPADARLDIGILYEGLDIPTEAIAQYDLWITAHPDDSRRGLALNNRCWARALLNRDLPQALNDCDGAVRRFPGNAGYLDSRGLVHLRMGDYDKAIVDYDRGLAIRPGMAWSLYGRGLAKMAKGDAAAGRADIAAATAIAADLPARARRYGLVPPAGSTP